MQEPSNDATGPLSTALLLLPSTSIQVNILHLFVRGSLWVMQSSMIRTCTKCKSRKKTNTYTFLLNPSWRRNECNEKTTIEEREEPLHYQLLYICIEPGQRNARGDVTTSCCCLSGHFSHWVTPPVCHWRSRRVTLTAALPVTPLTATQVPLGDVRLI